jgi:uncharacterized protein YjbJ (UPF0337 family)
MATRRSRDTWGLLDMLKGKAKEAAGAKRGDESLRREGQAQQRKADHLWKARQARLDAKKHEENARRHEREERSHQGT